MVSSSLRSFETPRKAYLSCATPRTIAKAKHGLNLSFLIVFIFLGFAMMLAPESPEQFSSICLKHNSASACRIW